MMVLIRVQLLQPDLTRGCTLIRTHLLYLMTKVTRVHLRHRRRPGTLPARWIPSERWSEKLAEKRISTSWNGWRVVLRRQQLAVGLFMYVPPVHLPLEMPIWAVLTKMRPMDGRHGDWTTVPLSRGSATASSPSVPCWNASADFARDSSPLPAPQRRRPMCRPTFIWPSSRPSAPAGHESWRRSSVGGTSTRRILSSVPSLMMIRFQM
mmetsp:Transcript_25712/g.74379  ORF Transcript_25712/g.74379 Transcript_25712/m.74379 type:complete len:208 (+) Transcript_25712:1140-1763(+)